MCSLFRNIVQYITSLNTQYHYVDVKAIVNSLVKCHYVRVYFIVLMTSIWMATLDNDPIKHRFSLKCAQMVYFKCAI